MTHQRNILLIISAIVVLFCLFYFKNKRRKANININQTKQKLMLPESLLNKLVTDKDIKYAKYVFNKSIAEGRGRKEAELRAIREVELNRKDPNRQLYDEFGNIVL